MTKEVLLIESNTVQPGKAMSVKEMGSPWQHGGRVPYDPLADNHDGKAELLMAPTPEIATRVGDLKTELTQAIAHYNFRARAAYWLAHTLMILTVGSSAAATLCGLLGANSKITGGIASLPAILALIAITFKPAGRANWHYRKKDCLYDLRRRLLYELPETPSADNVAAISNAWSCLTRKMSEEWEHEFTLSWPNSNKAHGSRWITQTGHDRDEIDD